MPRIRTDDGPRRLRAVWLGPAGATLPFEWTYVQWILTLLLIPTGMVVVSALMWLLTSSPSWTLAIGIPWGGAAGVQLARMIMRGVSPDEPLSYRRRLLQREFSRRSGRHAKPDEVLRVDMTPSPTIGYLSPRILAEMGWLVPDQLPTQTRAPREELSDMWASAPRPPAASPVSPDVSSPLSPVLVAMPGPAGSVSPTSWTSTPVSEAAPSTVAAPSGSPARANPWLNRPGAPSAAVPASAVPEELP